MGLAGAVVADDQQALVVGGLLELQLRDDEIGELFGHLVRDYVGFDELPRRLRLVGVTELEPPTRWVRIR